MFDVQVWLARDVIIGRIELREKDEMLADVELRIKTEDALENDDDCIWYQGDYS